MPEPTTTRDVEQVAPTGAGAAGRAPENIGLGDPNAADRQGDIAADDAGATADLTNVEGDR